MREILFRGKRIDNDEWVYGGILQTDNWSEISVVNDYYGSMYEPPSCEVDSYEVIPETVGQYTGLTDKNGKKIFEGDIISIPFEKDRYPYEENVIHYENAEVYFDTERYSWYVRHSDDDLVSLWEYDDRDIIVIGNIYDNPELLERGQ